LFVKPFPSKLGVAVLLAALALTLASCGRRGPLEPPPDAAALNTRPLSGTPGDEEKPANPGDLPEQNAASSRSTAAPAQAGANQPPPRTPKPFVLDPLL
jgi:predicted small lipoprotein YifL